MFFHTVTHFLHSHIHCLSLSLSLSVMSDYFFSPCKPECGLGSAGCPGTHRQSLSSNVGRSNGVIFCISSVICGNGVVRTRIVEFHIKIERVRETESARERENERD